MGALITGDGRKYTLSERHTFNLFFSFVKALTLQPGKALTHQIKNEVCLGARKPSGCLGFPRALTVLLQLLFTHFKFPDLQVGCCHVTRTSGW